MCIRDRAKTCGINAENLSATVARYNELCEAGEDTDFGKKPNDLIPLSEGPYYAIEESGACLVTVNGLRINADSQVLTQEGSVIEGLYAVGNASGSMFNGTYPHHMSCLLYTSTGEHEAVRGVEILHDEGNLDGVACPHSLDTRLVAE